MITDAEKIEIIKWVAGLKDKEVLRQLKKMREKSSPEPNDWWVALSPEEKQSIEKGLDDFKKKKVVQHSIVRFNYEKYL